MDTLKTALLNKLFGHKYAIDAQRLGDDAVLAWSNLGYWQQNSDYPKACQQLADQLAQAVQLCSQDRLLDLGCGQGASLVHWLKSYHIQSLSAIELQAACITKIQQYLPQVACYQQSFVDLAQLDFTDLFDVILCIDAAYHCDLTQFLASVQPVLKHKGRLAFHYLMWSDQWQHASVVKQQQYHYLLKMADVSWQHLMSEQHIRVALAQQGFQQIEIQDFSQPVLAGFADYIEQQSSERTRYDMAQFKIAMTAKLCRKLFEDDLVHYVQVSAVKQD